MHIKYKNRRYYWDLDRLKENLFNASMFIGAVLCYIIGGRIV